MSGLTKIYKTQHTVLPNIALLGYCFKYWYHNYACIVFFFSFNWSVSKKKNNFKATQQKIVFLSSCPFLIQQWVVEENCLAISSRCTIILLRQPPPSTPPRLSPTFPRPQSRHSCSSFCSRWEMKGGTGRMEGTQTAGVTTEEKERAQGSTVATEGGRKLVEG